MKQYSRTIIGRGGTLIYKAKSQSSFLYFLLVLGTARVISTKGLTVIDIVMIIGILAILCLHYKFQIDKKSLRYQIFLLSIPIYKKEIVPEQITEIKFIRVGWAKKSAIVRMKKGFNIRVILFNPNSVCEDLEHFANENNVSVNKTRDYKILER